MKNFKFAEMLEEYSDLCAKIDETFGISILEEFPIQNEYDTRLINFFKKYRENGSGPISFHRAHLVPDDRFGCMVFAKTLSFLFVPPSGLKWSHTESIDGYIDEDWAREKAGFSKPWVPEKGQFRYHEEEGEWMLHASPHEIIEFKRLDNDQFLFWDNCGEYYYPILVKDVRHYVKEVKEKEA